MSRIAVLVTDEFEDIEYTEPAEAFRRAAMTSSMLVFLRVRRSTERKRRRRSPSIRPPLTYRLDEFDALFIPGGYSPDKLRAHDAPVVFVREFAESGKPMFTICHAPQLLITAQVLEGRTITGWKSVAQDIRNAGAEYVDREVVVDGNLVSSRNPPIYRRSSRHR